jgi:signal transduction histidine kinase
MIRWLSSLRWWLLVSIIMVVLLVLVNIWITAQLMFISVHDFVLTIALLVFGGVTAIAFGLYITRTMMTRLQKLSDAAESLASGDLTHRLTIEGTDELAEFARTFNWMAENLQEVDRQKQMVEQARRDLIAWTSHDLRTPLTSLRVMLEALSDNVVTDPEGVDRYLRNSLAEIENLSHLINDLFELARLDAGKPDMAFEYASLRDLISDILSSMVPQAEQQGIRLEAEVGPDIDPVYMAPDKIQRVIRNLVENALRHTPADGKVLLRAVRSGDDVRVAVHNTGSSIDPIHLPHIFNSFYRVDTARLHSREGRRNAGLGLAIARGFIEAHQGMIDAQSDPTTGTTFSFAIPRTASA